MISMQAKYVIINRTLTLAEDAKIGIDDLSIVRGYGIFDYFKAINNIPLFLEDNLDRFYKSARLMDLPVNYSREEIKAQIQSLMDHNKIQDSGIKILLTGGYSTDGYSIADPNLIITQHIFNRDTSREKNGMKLHLFDFHRAFGLVKSIDYVMGIQALKVAKQQGADDVLYFQNGLISECPRANFFIITEDNKLVTPDEDVLEGVTRKHILEIAKGHFHIETRNVTLDDVKNAKEAFITSTTKNITPITEIVNFKTFDQGVGPCTAQLQELLEIHMENSLKK